MKKCLLLLAVCASAALFHACQKTDVANEADMITSEDAAAHEDIAEQTDLDADIAIEERGGGGSGCPTVTFEKTKGNWPNTITIDFGDNCVRPDGRVLKGKMIINQTDEIWKPGAQRVVAYQGFFVDSVEVQGTRKWVNNGLDANNKFHYTKTATDMKLIFPDGTSSSWNATRTSTLIQGGLTPTYLDNVWSSTGSASGVNRKGTAFSALITEPLIKKTLCRWISEGVIELTRGDKKGTFDFGDGDCDRFGKLTTADGDVITIKLRR